MQNPPSAATWLHAPRSRPLCIAHRGASDYAHDNSRASFERAVRLGADWFEVDVRTTADARLVAWHDPTTRQLSDESFRIEELTWHELQTLAEAANRAILLFDEVLELAAPHGIGIYVDAKDATAVRCAAGHLSAQGIDAGVIASYNVQSLQRLGRQGCAYPRAVLVPAGGDPVDLAERAGASIVHLCWANADARQQRCLNLDLLDRIRAAGLRVVLWHQEDRAIIEEWLSLPVWGICSNKPELLRSYRHQSALWKPQIMCEGGLGFVAPPQSLPAASVALNAGYDFIRVNTSLASDGSAVTGDPAGATSLDDMLSLARSHARGLAIEVHPRTLTTLLTSVTRQNALADSLFWSNQPACLADLQARAPLARIIVQRRHLEPLADACVTPGPRIIQFDAESDDLGEIALCTGPGMSTLIRYLGDDRDVLRRVIAARPAIVNVERPDLLRALL